MIDFLSKFLRFVYFLNFNLLMDIDCNILSSINNPEFTL